MGAVRTRCIHGHNHPSKGEAGHCELLHLELRAQGTTLLQIEYEKGYRLEVGGKLICRHYPDWTLTRTGGIEEVVEFKGFETAVWKLKHKLFLALYPNIQYTVVKK